VPLFISLSNGSDRDRSNLMCISMGSFSGPTRKVKVCEASSLKGKRKLVNLKWEL
jgi:hypothetical protein